MSKSYGGGIALTERGIIRNRERASQLARFDGLRFGKSTPSDVDGVYDFGGRAFIVFELKSDDAPLPTGQRLLLQNMVDGWRDGGRLAAAMVARHDAPIGQDIDAGAALVSDVWFNKRWYQVNGATLRQMVERFLLKHAPGELRRLTGATFEGR